MIKNEIDNGMNEINKIVENNEELKKLENVAGNANKLLQENPQLMEILIGIICKILI